jgi:hypothetical protein
MKTNFNCVENLQYALVKFECGPTYLYISLPLDDLVSVYIAFLAICHLPQTVLTIALPSISVSITRVSNRLNNPEKMRLF